MIIAKNITVVVDDNEYLFQEHEESSITVTSKKDGQSITIPENCLSQVVDVLNSINKLHTHYDW